jgi:hypothetical protein
MATLERTGARRLGYQPARIETLCRHAAEAAAELDELDGGELPGTEVAAAVRTIVDDLRSEWIPVLRRIAADTTLTSWSAVAVPVALVAAVPPPPGGDADAVARWWAGLTATEQLSLIDSNPSSIGNRDGVPAWARDRANRRLLGADLASLAAEEAAGTLTDDESAVLASAEAIATALAEGAKLVDPRTGMSVTVQLYLYEPAAYGGDGRVALSLGDLDTARHVAVTVPGMGTEASRIATTVPEVVYRATATHTSDSIAVMTWLGYDAPSLAVADGTVDGAVDDVSDWIDEAGDLAHVLTIGEATRGAAVLATGVSGVRAMRGEDRVHVTVVGNSYGSTTVAIAADEFALEADDVVLTGSPGAGRADDAAELTSGRAHTWVGSASDDPVSYLGRTGGAEPHDLVEFVPDGVVVGLGRDPAEDDFGAQRFGAEWVGRDDQFPWPLDGHSHYFDPCAEAPDNIGAIVAGDHDAVRLAEHRHKDESWDLWDPLGDLLPTDPEADEPIDGACPLSYRGE